jgi:hypothetical protein
MLQRSANSGHDANIFPGLIGLSGTIEDLALSLGSLRFLERSRTNSLSSSSANCTRITASILSAYRLVTLFEGSCCGGLMTRRVGVTSTVRTITRCGI